MEKKEPQMAVFIWEILSQANEEPQNKHGLSEVSYIWQEWPI